ncbi:MAG: MarR family transcriptional regulator [Methanoregulaceae archaeon]|nr:MAG: MarR family transcriptional regulator [Methanoregulaceae archaeon]
MLNNVRDDGCNTAEKFMDLFARLLNKAALIEQEPVDTGDGVLLCTSEIHLIDMAGRFPEESMSALASHLGITKGAVSQTVKKLEKKGYLERINREGNKKTVFIRLTDSGIQAFTWHRAYHAMVNDRIAREIARYEGKDRKYICKILLQMEKIFDECPETRRRITQEIVRNLPGKT